MRIGALVGWGIAIYAVIFLLWSGFTIYGFTEGVLPRLSGLLVLIVLALIAGRSLRFATYRDIVPYSLIWTVEIIVLDIIFSVPFTGWALFSDWNVWVGYAIVIIAPLFAPFTRRPHHIPEAFHHES